MSLGSLVVDADGGTAVEYIDEADSAVTVIIPAGLVVLVANALLVAEISLFKADIKYNVEDIAF